MELKYGEEKGKQFATKGLIVPLWNWNILYRIPDTTLSGWFNRTFMELKSSPRSIAVATSSRFNRTFMELKSGNGTERLLRLPWFNRTFMELKYSGEHSQQRGEFSLIVPLWNWNSTLSVLASSLGRFNRTFMELKFWCCSTYFNWISWFNRTFMELKYIWPWTAWSCWSRFNRTFMELKYRRKTKELEKIGV